jgi:large subunit ribosomal protein L23
MALFGTKKNKVVETKKPEAKTKAVKKVSGGSQVINSSVILRPYITEKAGLLAEKNVYTFEVAPSSNKVTISKAIEHIYKVVPTKIAVVTLKPEVKLFKNRIKGKTPGGKKAYVYLKEGDKIEFI